MPDRNIIIIIRYIPYDGNHHKYPIWNWIPFRLVRVCLIFPPPPSFFSLFDDVMSIKCARANRWLTFAIILNIAFLFFVFSLPNFHYTLRCRWENKVEKGKGSPLHLTWALSPQYTLKPSNIFQKGKKRRWFKTVHGARKRGELQRKPIPRLNGCCSIF